jgi:hypothetical protein
MTMSFNLSSQNSVEALFVFVSLLAERGYRVMSVSMQVREGVRHFRMDFVPFHDHSGWIECEFDYSQIACKMRIAWRNQNTSKSGKILLEGIHAGHAGQWDNFRPQVDTIFA